MTAENHSVKDSASLHQLTFHIVDSAMGAGKSESLLDRARFNGAGVISVTRKRWNVCVGMAGRVSSRGNAA